MAVEDYVTPEAFAVYQRKDYLTPEAFAVYQERGLPHSGGVCCVPGDACGGVRGLWELDVPGGPLAPWCAPPTGQASSTSPTCYARARGARCSSRRRQQQQQQHQVQQQWLLLNEQVMLLSFLSEERMILSVYSVKNVAAAAAAVAAVLSAAAVAAPQ
eukprot:1147552-Pelagomonas_calceolata.AAC.1